jgi:hypothetical protein
VRVTTVAALSVIISAATLAAPAAAHADVLDAPIVVPINRATDVVADAATEQVFVSTGQDDTVVVLSYDGTVVDTLTGIDNAAGMALDPDSGTVFVAEPTSNKIAAIDTTTLDVTHYATSGTPCPRTVTVADGVVFYGHSGDSCSSWGGIGVLDLSKTLPTGVSTNSGSYYHPQVVSAAGVLVVAELGLSPSSPDSYAISGTTLTHLAYRYDVGSNTGDLAIAPDASEVVIASGAPYEHPAYDPTTLEPLYTYPTTNYPNAAAISDGGSLVALGTNSSYDTDIWLFNRGNTSLVEPFELEDLSPSMTLYPGGLAFGGTDRLFAIGWETYYDDQRYLVIQNLVAKQETTLTVSVPDSVQVGDEVNVTGRLGVGSEFAGEAITIERLTQTGSAALGGAIVEPDGTFSFVDVPPSFGPTRYVARWSGTETYAAAVGISDPVSVRRLPSTLTVETDAATYRAGQRATVTVGLDHVDAREGVLELYRVDADGSHRVRTDSFDEQALTFQVRVDTDGYFEAVYRGDDVHRPATARSAEYTVEPAVRATVDGYFRRDGNHWWLRPSVAPEVTWTVTPAPVGPCAMTTLQVMTSDGWRTLRRSSCVDVLHSASLTRTFNDDRVDGTQWRVRLSAGATDTHAEVKSRWTYLTFKALPTARQAG